METLLDSPGAWIDVLGGATQVLFGVYLFSTRRGSGVLTFAVFLALNGSAFLLGNLVPRGHSLFPILRMTAWGILNWLALLAVVVTSIRLTEAISRRHLARAAAALVGILLAILSWASVPPSVSLIAFGGSAVYAGVASLLVVSLVLATHGGTPASRAATLVAMIAINSGLHAGVGLAARPNAYTIAHGALLICMAGLWFGTRAELSAKLTAALPLAISVGLGFVAVMAFKTQSAVQDSGVYGIGRALSMFIGMFAVHRGLLFQDRRTLTALPSAA